jgi:hypothetical protein
MTERVLAYIDELIDRYDDPEMTESENPMDDSGGNFDDAYYMGIEYGKMLGRLDALRKVKEFIQKEVDALSQQ